MSKFKTITLEKRVRTFTKTDIRSRTLSNGKLQWLEPGAKIVVGAPEQMAYDHRDQTVVQIIDVTPERFIIVSELERDPWFVQPQE